MLRFIFLCVIVACFLPQESISGTVKRKRQAGTASMLSDYSYGSGEDYYHYPDAFPTTLYFYITYGKQFDVDLLSTESSAFRKEAKRVARSMVTQIARNIGLIAEDVTVEVISFAKGSTKAEIAVKIPGDYQITEEELSKAVNDVATDGGTVAGSAILGIEEIKLSMTDDPDYGITDSPDYSPTETIILDIEITYEYDSSSTDLSDIDSEDFKAEALTVQQELTLHLVGKLASQGILVTPPNELDIKINSLRSVGSETQVALTIEAQTVSIEQLNGALESLVTDDDVGINGRAITSIEEVSRSVAYIYDDGDEMPPMDMEVMGPHDYADDLLNGERVPPDDNTLIPPIDSEVMFPKDTDDILNGGDSLNGNDYEPVPDYGDYTAPSTGERLPPDASVTCPSIIAPERGVMECLNGNGIGSICLFTCDEDTNMEGSDSIICDADGAWSADVPYCVRIYCQPHHITLDNGGVDCTDSNTFQSVCMFTCNDRHTMTGSKSVICQKNESWSDPAPMCEPDPVNCEEEYGDWSACENGKRIKESVMISSSSTSVVCPEIVEDCINCELDWGPWEECDDGVRSRTQYVLKEKVGAGEDCPEPKVSQQQCFDCVIEWGEWSTCSGGTRTRSQYVKVTPVGGSECPPRETETQDCVDCVVEWSEWSDCYKGEAARTQYITQAAANGGKECPLLELEKEKCTDCVEGWGEWSTCTDNVSIRQEIILVEPEGRGKQCTELLQSEEQECRNCEVAWSDWGECEAGARSRQLEIISPAIGNGAQCPPGLDEETEECVHCEMEWGDWGECIEGQRQRTEVIVVEPRGAGDPCRSPNSDSKSCAKCEISWGDWTVCENQKRERKQFISQAPFEVEEPCPELDTEEEACIDCVSSWGPWGECLNGLQERTLIIEEDPVGAGEACPEENYEVQECCFYEWGEWSECENGDRTRNEQIVVQPQGETCPPGKQEFESCVDCIVEWGPWGEECIDNTVFRYQFIKQAPVGAGDICPELQIEADLCANCEVEWEQWSECVDNYRERSQVILVEQVGAGSPCPDLEFETQECANCEVEWSEWSECGNGKRSRTQNIVVSGYGGGNPCPVLQDEEEDCVDCVVDWREWSKCESGSRIREMYIKVAHVGYGAECPPLDAQQEVCANCEVDWWEWSECSNNMRSRRQYVAVEAFGGGESCPELETEEEACIDCVVEWGPWTDCFGELRTRRQEIVVPLVGAGRECPPLESETEACIVPGSKKALEKTICRFTEEVLGYKKNHRKRDLLLIGDESGSIGWVNFAKIKENFKAIARNIRGGIGSEETQLAMTSFARFSRTLFDFDDFDNAIDVVAAIDEAYFLGGYRSRIGDALEDANRWLFQQTGGMRSFPNIDDSIEHELLIATDGCRTADKYMLQEGLKTIKKRGIKLYVLGIESKDKRCAETVESMVEDKNNLFQLGSWEQLDELNKRLEEKVCITSEVRVDDSDRRGDEGTSEGDAESSFIGDELPPDDGVEPSPLNDGSRRGDGV
ncbi:uncharacterized protein LOC120343026 isoform X1 [Styela clava]